MPPKRRRHVLCLLVAAAGALTACATGDDWKPQPTFAPLPAVFVEVPALDLRKQCGDRPGFDMHGCARRDYAGNVCVIYTGPSPAPWLRTHELAHCAGYDHAAPSSVQAALR